jgi:hypothetical protein
VVVEPDWIAAAVVRWAFFSERAAPGDVNRYHQRTYDNGIFFGFSVFFLMLGL